MRTPLLRLEIRQRNSRRRAWLITISIPALFFVGVGVGDALASIGPLSTLGLASLGGFVGFCFAKLLSPLL